MSSPTQTTKMPRSLSSLESIQSLAGAGRAAAISSRTGLFRKRKFVGQVAPLDKRVKANKEDSRTLSALLPKPLSGE